MNVRDSPPEVMVSLLSPAFRVVVAARPAGTSGRAPARSGAAYRLAAVAGRCRSRRRYRSFRPSLSRPRSRCSRRCRAFRRFPRAPRRDVPPVPVVASGADRAAGGRRTARAFHATCAGDAAGAARTAGAFHAPGTGGATGAARSAAAVVTTSSGAWCLHPRSHRKAARAERMPRRTSARLRDKRCGTKS